MGKATIISGGTDGRYTIKIDAGSQQQASRLETIETSLASVAARIPEAQAEYLAATTKETYAAGALNAAIENYAAAVAQDPETASTADVDRLTGDYYTAARFAGEARTRLQDLTLQQRQLESDKSNITSAPVSETRQAWCADLTEDAAGEVATIEVPGEPDTVLVAPGGRAPSAGDGALVARELMTPEQAFFNAAILPGWQKWMPTFRTGTITAINSDNDTADVSLDAATSSAQGLGVNQTSSLSDVPVEYMECNAAAFEVGDPCVVRFDGQSWDAPKVVGFAREPKGCWPKTISIILEISNSYGEFFRMVHADNIGSDGCISPLVIGATVITAKIKLSNTIEPSPSEPMTSTVYIDESNDFDIFSMSSKDEEGIFYAQEILPMDYSRFAINGLVTSYGGWGSFPAYRRYDGCQIIGYVSGYSAEPWSIKSTIDTTSEDEVFGFLQPHLKNITISKKTSSAKKQYRPKSVIKKTSWQVVYEIIDSK